LRDRKFFGNPNGTKAPAKQSKLSFSSKSGNAAAPKAEVEEDAKDAEMKDDDSDKEVKSKVKKEEAVDSKENVKPGKGMRSVK
jgi:DNA ligase-1